MYSAREKKEAIELAMIKGVTEASKITGISDSTLKLWARSGTADEILKNRDSNKKYNDRTKHSKKKYNDRTKHSKKIYSDESINEIRESMERNGCNAAAVKRETGHSLEYIYKICDYAGIDRHHKYDMDDQEKIANYFDQHGAALTAQKFNITKESTYKIHRRFYGRLKHGKSIYTPELDGANMIICTSCGYKIYQRNMYIKIVGGRKKIRTHLKYCPNCGAKFGPYDE